MTTVTGQETAGIDFQLRRRGSITGRVVDAATGAPLPGAYVIAYSPAGYHLGGSLQADAAGNFELGNLPEGELIAAGLRPRLPARALP